MKQNKVDKVLAFVGDTQIDVSAFESKRSEYIKLLELIQIL